MRTAFIQQLIEEAKENDSIFLLVGDLGYSVVEPFAEMFLERFLNVGIAEQNMTGIAAGLAKEGYNVFTYSIGNFPTLRCMEQIRYDICYHKLSVKIVAVGGGYAYGPLGASHHTTEDIGMLRVIPNMNVCAPGDPIETRQITSLMCSNNLPCYLRLGKAGEPIIHDLNRSFDWGDIIKVIGGKDIAVLSTGGMLNYSFFYINENKKKWSLYSIPFIKPLNIFQLIGILQNYDELITIEEHQKSGGFSSSILEAVNDIKNTIDIDIPKITTIAINDKFLDFAGSQEYLKNKAGLTF